MWTRRAIGPELPCTEAGAALLAASRKADPCRTWILGALLAATPLLGALLPGCATGSFVDWVYRDAQTAYRVGPLPEAWHRLTLAGGDVAFRHDSGGSVLAEGLCGSAKDTPLDVLTNQALFGIEAKQERSRVPITLDGRAALDTHLVGTLDGVPIELELVVLKKDGCTYDLQLAAGPDTFAARTGDFHSFVAGFHELSVAAR